MAASRAVAGGQGRTADEALDAHARGMGFANAADARTRQHPGTGFHLLRAELSNQPAMVADLAGGEAETLNGRIRPGRRGRAAARQLRRGCRCRERRRAEDARRTWPRRRAGREERGGRNRADGGDTACDLYLARVLVLAGADPNAEPLAAPAAIDRADRPVQRRGSGRLFADLAERATLDGPLDDVIAEEGRDCPHHAKLDCRDLAQSHRRSGRAAGLAAAYFSASEVMQARVFEPRGARA